MKRMIIISALITTACVHTAYSVESVTISATSPFVKKVDFYPSLAWSAQYDPAVLLVNQTRQGNQVVFTVKPTANSNTKGRSTLKLMLGGQTKFEYYVTIQ